MTTSNNPSRKVKIRLLARHQGNQFHVELRAIKRGAGLIRTERSLEIGGRLVLVAPDPVHAQASMQLFASVVRHYEAQHAYALRWEKLMSPTGSASLLQFLQATLGIQVSSDAAMAREHVAGEMVYFDFNDQQLHAPNSGLVLGRDPARRSSLQAETTVDFDPDSLVTGALRRPDSRPGGPSTGRLSPQLGKRNTLEEKAAAAAKEAEARGEPFYTEGDDVVELFGMKVSKENWDRLENLQYSGTHGGEATRTQTSHAKAESPARKQSEPRPANGETNEAPAKKKVSSFLRKLAGKLADKE